MPLITLQQAPSLTTHLHASALIIAGVSLYDLIHRSKLCLSITIKKYNFRDYFFTTLYIKMKHNKKV